METRENHPYDVIVIGAGHAGVEAALASSRIGCNTLLLTGNIDTIAKMSCNPSIGGIGKGHIVREIDALGGEMGACADHTGLNFRLLNTKNGPAVRATRAQCDKKAYHIWMKSVVENAENLTLKQGDVEDLVQKEGNLFVIHTNTGRVYEGICVVVTAGTFLTGLIHVGHVSFGSGRAGDPPSVRLSKSLAKLGIKLGRLKTGTPPRILGSTIDFSKTVEQHGDHKPDFFSFQTPTTFHVEQIPCHITKTTKHTTNIIRENLNKSSLYSGKIQGIGPRYCPSIEDKVVRFDEKEYHQIFLEPECRDANEYYVGGLSTSLPEEVQEGLLHSIIGLERAKIMRYAYAVEYDFAPAYQLHSTLESKIVSGLFIAGQLNGTSGYEEAAAQGLVAGINAALKFKGLDQLIISRSDSYIGVLIDDLVTLDIQEPYRMFTARAENRLELRYDNADMRLAPIGRQVGLISEHRWNEFSRKKALIRNEITRLKSIKIGSASQFDILRQPERKYLELEVSDGKLDQSIALAVEIEAKYEWYIQRNMNQIDQISKMAGCLIPEWINYHKIPSLRTEAVLKLSAIKPDTLSQATRIAGVTKSDIAVLAVWLKKHTKSNSNPMVNAFRI